MSTRSFRPLLPTPEDTSSAPPSPGGADRSWFESGLRFDHVEATGAWSQSAGSFSDWMDREATRLGVSRTGVWRNLAVVRYYAGLQVRLSGARVTCPVLSELPATVGPESLELLAKLERVMPSRDFNELAGDVVAGRVRRAKLRELWVAFRPALGGRTARGRGAEVPFVDMCDPTQVTSMLEGLVFTALTDHGPAWTGTPNPCLYRLIANVVPQRPVDDLTGLCSGPITMIDLVAVVRETSDSPLAFHGIEIRGAIHLPQLPRELLQQSYFVHAMWLALPALPPELQLAELPNDVGLLIATKDKVEVVRAAERRTDDRLTGRLTAGIVARLLGI